MFCKKDALKDFATFTAKKTICTRAAGYNFIKKETLTQAFSCEFFKMSKNTFFHRTPPVAASGSKQSFRYVSDQLLRIPQLC